MELLTQEELRLFTQKREQMIEQFNNLTAQARELGEAIKRMDKVLHLVSGETPAKPSTNGKPRRKPERRQVSKARVEEVARVLSASYTPLTCKAIASRMGISTSTVRNALIELRADGVVRVVGKQPNPSGKGLQPELYSVYSNENPIPQT